MSEDVFFTADTHFDHSNIVWLGRGRPWDDAREMTEAMIERWNERVRPHDRVYHLGDFAFASRPRTEEILDRLNGQIHFIRGNHDKGMDRLADRFASYQQYKEIKVGTQRIVMFHFPLVTWHKGAQGAWHLHGHCHGNLPDEGLTRLDIGVDSWGYAPASYDDIAVEMSRRTYRAVDHHEASG